MFKRYRQLLVVEWCPRTAGNAEWALSRHTRTPTETKSTRTLFINVVKDELGMDFCYFCEGTELLNPSRFKASQKWNKSSTVRLVLFKEASTKHTLPFQGTTVNATRMGKICLHFKAAVGFMNLVTLQWHFHCYPAKCWLVHCFCFLILDQRLYKSIAGIQKSCPFFIFYSFIEA